MFAGALDISGAPAAAPTSLSSASGVKRRIATPATAVISPADDVIEKINDKLDLLAELLLNLEARVRMIEAGLFVTVTGPKDCPMLADLKKALKVYSDKARANKKHGMGSPHKFAAERLVNQPRPPPREAEAAMATVEAIGGVAPAGDSGRAADDDEDEGPFLACAALLTNEAPFRTHVHGYRNASKHRVPGNVYAGCGADFQLDNSSCGAAAPFWTARHHAA